MTGRLLLWHAVAVVSVLVALGVVADRVLERFFVGQLTDSLVAEARGLQQVLPADQNLQADVARLGRAIGVRITIIRTDGVVLADSQSDPSTMQNHRNRPEVQQALRGLVGTASRESATVGVPYRYVALPPSGGRIVRVALPLTAIQSRLLTVRLILGLGFGAAALAGLAGLALIARGLSGPIRRITGAVERVGRGDLAAEVPEEGTSELSALARTVNRMRREVSERMGTIEEERTARDAILSALDEGVSLFGEDGTVLYENERAGLLLGAPIERASRLVPASLARVVSAARSGGAPETVEVVGGSAGRTIRGTAVPVPGRRVLLILRDVTEALVVDAVRRDFVANASHELKTPAASLRALAETIRSSAAEDPLATRRFAAQLEREATRLSRIISDLLDLSRLEGGPPVRAPVRLDRLVVDEAGRFRSAAEDAGLSFHVEADPSVLVQGSAGDLALMLRNLVQNAIQYTARGGTVSVAVRERGGAALLTVQDTGVGIPGRDRTRIFERFFRVDRGRSRETGGTGLGLSIVRHVVENHGGSVTVESELGRGSTFRVRIPVASDRAPSQGPGDAG